MSLLLHLSDLHLGPRKPSDTVGDYKSSLVQYEDQTSRYAVLQEVFSQLSSKLIADRKTLEAVIISGDVTVANDEAGFAKLEEVLSWLGDACPKQNRVLVVPGNHDVTWGTAPSTTERYEFFLKHIRAKEYITPLLEGVDLDHDGRFEVNPKNHYLTAADGRWAIIPINSSNYCGSMQPLAAIREEDWNRLPQELAARSASSDREAIANELKRLRLKDVARISTAQLLSLRRLVEHAKADCLSKGNKPTLFAVIHHQLLPVTTFEEFKEFESITNLGQVRSALRDVGVSVVFHGHKHAELHYVDNIPKMLPLQPEKAHPVSVISAPAPTQPNFVGGSVGALIEVCGHSVATALSITKIPWFPIGSQLRLNSPFLHPLSTDCKLPSLEAAELTKIDGATVDEVYERALACFSEPFHTTLPNLVCRIAGATHPVPLPSAYPGLRHVPAEDRADWFTGLVKWWQKSSFQRLSPGSTFNHGHRIFSYETLRQFHTVDQIEQAIEALSSAPLSSRAVVTLLKPHVDNIGSDTRFPSFCFIHFIIRRTSGAPVLEAIGYFRKQEFRHWWPVNVAEMASLQQRVFDRVRHPVSKQLKQELQLGPITTIAAIAELGRDIPGFLVPAVDFDLEVQPQRLWDMTYAVSWREMPNRRSYIPVWEATLNDLVPAKTQDLSGVLVPVRGVAYLAEITRHFAVHHPEFAAGLATRWKSLASLNESHAKQMAERKLSDDEHERWRSEVITCLEGVRRIVETSLECSLPELE